MWTNVDECLNTTHTERSGALLLVLLSISAELYFFIRIKLGGQYSVVNVHSPFLIFHYLQQEISFHYLHFKWSID